MPSDPRTFITVHDGMPEHPKIEELSDAGFRLLITLWCWCARNETDGEVKTAAWSKRGSAKTRRELIEAGLVESIPTGYYMHDYLEHQRSTAEIKALRRKRAAAGSKGGKAKASATASAKQSAGKTVADKEEAFQASQKNSSTSTGSRNVPTGGPAQAVRAYVECAKNAGVPAPEEAQDRVSRSARSLLSQGYDLDAVVDAARNAAVGGWSDLAQQIQRDAARVTAPRNGIRSTTDDRSGHALVLADELDRKAIG